MSTSDQPTEEELRAAYEAEIKKIRVEQILLDQVVSLINLGMRRTGLSPGTEDERDLGQVRLSIEAVRALLPLIEQAAPPQAAPIRDALSQLQLAFVRLGGAGQPGGAPGRRSGRRGPGGPGGPGAGGPGGPGPGGPGGPGTAAPAVRARRSGPGRSGRSGRSRRARRSRRPGPAHAAEPRLQSPGSRVPPSAAAGSGCPVSRPRDALRRVLPAPAPFRPTFRPACTLDSRRAYAGVSAQSERGGPF